jgi:hypothetical protein
VNLGEASGVHLDRQCFPLAAGVKHLQDVIEEGCATPALERVHAFLSSDAARQIVQTAQGLISLESLAGIDFRSFVTSANLDFNRVGYAKRHNQSQRGSQTN